MEAVVRTGEFDSHESAKRTIMNANLNQSSTDLMHGLLQGRPHPEVKEGSASPVLGRFSSSRPTMKKILLADDDPGIREMLGRVLESEHYEVILAKNGNEAGAKFVSREPDIVLLDLNMPDRDGWSAFRFMEVVHPLLPVIIITARPDQYAQAEKLGVDALMEKPLNLPVLLEAIEGLLAETETERTRRLINRHFKTAFLNHRKQPALNGTDR
jgi:CheY-like chemotaxis protein